MCGSFPSFLDFSKWRKKSSYAILLKTKTPQCNHFHSQNFFVFLQFRSFIANVNAA